jgi:hypothetical protein
MRFTADDLRLLISDGTVDEGEDVIIEYVEEYILTASDVLELMDDGLELS